MGLLLLALAIVAVPCLLFLAIAYIAFWIVAGVFIACVIVLTLLLGPGGGLLAAIPATALIFHALGKSDDWSE